MAVHRRAAPAGPAGCDRRPASAAMRSRVPPRRHRWPRRAGESGGAAVPDAGDPVGGRWGRPPRGGSWRRPAPSGGTSPAGPSIESMAAGDGAGHQFGAFGVRHPPRKDGRGGRRVPFAGAAHPKPSRRSGAGCRTLGRADPAFARGQHGIGWRGGRHGAPPAAMVPWRGFYRGVSCPPSAGPCCQAATVFRNYHKSVDQVIAARAEARQ